MAGSLEDATARWDLAGAAPIAETPTSRVWKVERRDAGPAVLKILKPHGADEIGGAHLMGWYGGEGAAAIFDIHDEMILMEWLEFETLGDVVRSGRDDAAAPIICDVLGALHQPRQAPYPPELTPLERQFATLFREEPPAGHEEMFARAAELARTLLATTERNIPLHGDFHHDNIVRSNRGWLVIDPKGLLGDGAHDAANLFRNPVGVGELAFSPERIDGLAAAVEERLGLDPRRTLGWAVALSAISVYWHRSAGNPFDWDIRMLPHLIAALERAG